MDYESTDTVRLRWWKKPKNYEAVLLNLLADQLDFLAVIKNKLELWETDRLRLEALEHSRLKEEGETQFAYSREYGDDRRCECGHPYYRHFDTYDGMAPVGCKYCLCYRFIEQEPTQGEPVEPACLCPDTSTQQWSAACPVHGARIDPWTSSSPPAPTETREEAADSFIHQCIYQTLIAGVAGPETALDVANKVIRRLAYDRTLKGEAG